MRELKFGVFLPFYAFDSSQPTAHFGLVRDIVLECERLGYHSVWLDDHLVFKNNLVLESWTTLAALSAITTSIRLGIMASCNSFRNPALLAKMATTVDVISNGRLELALGAGVQEAEHLAYGFSFPEAKLRIDRMREAVEIIKKMWTVEKASYSGLHYRIDEAVCEPKPVQKPHPPITIAGSGEKLTSRVAALHADRFDWGYVPSIEMYKHKLEVLQEHCRAVGRDFQEIEKSCWPGSQIFIASDQKELGEKLSQLKPKGVSIEDFKKQILAGTPNDCRRTIQQYADLGVTMFMLFFGDLPNTDSLRLFAETVLSKMH